jgi:hypothetical protein
MAIPDWERLQVRPKITCEAVASIG